MLRKSSNLNYDPPTNHKVVRIDYPSFAVNDIESG